MVLSHEAWLNIEADLAAKNYISPQGTTANCGYHSNPGAFWLTIPKWWNITNGPYKWPLMDQQQNSIGTTNYQLHHCHSWNLTFQQWNEHLEFLHLDIVTRLQNTFCSWKNMVRQGQLSMAQCPHCQTETEDKSHILWCPAPSARTQWWITTQKLSRWMKDEGTKFRLQNAIMEHLNQDQAGNPLW